MLKAFEFLNGALKFTGQTVRIPFQENIKHCAVIPKGALAMSAETRPHGIAFCPIVGEDRTHVVELIGRAHQADIVTGLTQEREIVDLALFPGRFRDRVGVSAALNDRCDAISETCANLFEYRMTAAIFDDIVQQSGDGMVFVPSSLED